MDFKLLRPVFLYYRKQQTIFRERKNYNNVILLEYVKNAGIGLLLK